MMKSWMIREKKGWLFWSNKDGWVNHGEATRFTDEEKKTLNLPVGGEWYPEDWDTIPMKDCITRKVYAIHSRNLAYGVYNGKEGFIGIRTKFGSKFLFTEYHHDQGAPFGTVSPMYEVCDVPNEIELRENTDTHCSKCKKGVEFREENPDGTGTWYHIGSNDKCCGAPQCEGYKPLFKFLSKIEEERP